MRLGSDAKLVIGPTETILAEFANQTNKKWRRFGFFMLPMIATF